MPYFILCSADVSLLSSQPKQSSPVRQFIPTLHCPRKPSVSRCKLISIYFSRLNSRTSIRKTTELTSTNGGNVINLSAVHTRVAASENSKIQTTDVDMAASGVHIHQSVWSHANYESTKTSYAWCWNRHSLLHILCRTFVHHAFQFLSLCRIIASISSWRVVDKIYCRGIYAGFCRTKSQTQRKASHQVKVSFFTTIADVKWWQRLIPDISATISCFGVSSDSLFWGECQLGLFDLNKKLRRWTTVLVFLGPIMM